MHKWAKEIMEGLKAEVNAVGMSNLSDAQICNVVNWSKIASNIACFDKDYKICEAMEESEENEQKMDMIERYTDYPQTRNYDHYRYADGRFAPKGRGTYHKNYSRMTPEMYRNSDYNELRDMDRNYGRMYYSEMPMEEYRDVANEIREHRDAGRGGNYWENRNYSNGMSTSGTSSNMNYSSGNTRDYREGRSGMMRRNYMDSKEMHKSNTTEDKQAKMRELEKYMNELSSDVTEMISDASNEEKTMLKQKLETLKNKIM